MKVRDAVKLAAQIAVKGERLVPILGSLKFGDGRIVATDTTQQVEVPIETPKGLGQSGFCVSALRMVRVLKALPEDLELEMKLHERRLVVSAGRTRYELNTLAPEDFPAFAPEAPEPAAIEVESKQLVEALKFVAPAMAVNDARYYLNGVHVALAPGRLLFTATDGHRLHRARAATGDPDVKPVAGIVPAHVVARMIEIADRHAKVHIGLSATRLTLHDDEVLETKLIDGQFPEADRVIPSDRPATAGVQRAALFAAVNRVAAIVQGSKVAAVSLGFTRESINLSAKSEENETATEAFDWNASGAAVAEVELGFKPAYLTEALAAFSGERVNLHLPSDLTQSLYLTDDDDGSRQVVVMPMRL